MGQASDFLFSQWAGLWAHLHLGSPAKTIFITSKAWIDSKNRHIFKSDPARANPTYARVVFLGANTTRGHSGPEGCEANKVKERSDGLLLAFKLTSFAWNCDCEMNFCDGGVSYLGYRQSERTLRVNLTSYIPTPPGHFLLLRGVDTTWPDQPVSLPDANRSGCRFGWNGQPTALHTGGCRQAARSLTVRGQAVIKCHLDTRPPDDSPPDPCTTDGLPRPSPSSLRQYDPSSARL
ncbi:hypothetical protein PGTUg99_021325 [Puccinia graminis f. sp. tritici]|uniref:Uncharacterized protein n=1 Tax=Puccinia graminis f. sp. tritici TaxID=56615 RepID=A0A5B0RFS9_PUCGR|nr:hypothetical protein PGTUg99_021325 [Puccinia graminis f. sp. tritici]